MSATRSRQKRLKAFHMKCQRHTAKIRWHNHERNTDVSSLTGLGPVQDPIVCRHSSLFGHVARVPEDTPAHQALQCHIDLSLGRLPDTSRRRCPDRPRNRWIDQLYRDNSTPPADLWRRAVTRGYSGVTLRSSTTTH